MVRIYRQGDCLLRQLKSLKLGLHITVGHETTVMGETGHPHKVQVSQVIQTLDGRKIAVVENEGVIEHPEHAPVKLASGIYEVGRVRSHQIVDNFSS